MFFPATIPLELGLRSSLLPLTGELCTPLSAMSMLLLLCLALSTFLSLNRSCSKLPDTPLAVRSWTRCGRWAVELLLELGVILVLLLALDSGRGRARARLDPMPSSMFCMWTVDCGR